MIVLSHDTGIYPKWCMTHEQRATLTAVVDRIVPRDDFPSASEAGVLDFLDRLIPLERLEETYAAGLDAIEEQACERFLKSFADLKAEEQDEVLKGMETSTEPDGRFVRLLIEQTIEGYYADPGNGGNRNRVAWDMVGYRVTA